MTTEQELLDEEKRLLAAEGIEVNEPVAAALKPSKSMCENHEDRKAEFACAECGRSLCSECVYAAGGGHHFCQTCMDDTSARDLEPINTPHKIPAPFKRTALFLAGIILLASFALIVIYVFVSKG
jgi:B-box zinc finger